MTSLDLKTIDFDKEQVGIKQIECPYEIEITSPKSIAYVLRWQLAKKRSGSAKVKTMAEISGTTAKPYKQKGTGRARQGSKRSVQFVGGRTCHGPTPRSFDFSIPKKIIKKALFDIIKFKLKQNKVTLFSNPGGGIKTSKIKAALINNKLTNALIVFDGAQENSQFLIKSSRNLKNVKTLDLKAINVYDLLSFDNILIENNSFENKILGALI